MLTATVPSTNLLNFDYLDASKLLIQQRPHLVRLVLVGCGGTGSWLALTVARVARLLSEKFQRRVEVVFIDPDQVEEKNVYRQNFCRAEIGRSKAETLAQRCGLAWGLEIQGINKSFHDFAHSIPGYDSLVVYIGCVDRPSARREIRDKVANYDAWWLDCGNEKSSGQVLLGNSKFAPAEPFQLPGFCTWLPLPSYQHPELIAEQPADTDAPAPARHLSCADLALIDSQGLAINQRMAAEASDYLVRMLITKDLTRFQTYIDLASGSSRSTYITPANVCGKKG